MTQKIPYLSPAGVTFVRRYLANFPRPERNASDALGQWLPSQGVHLKPDDIEAVTLHYQEGADYGWTGIVAQRQRLVEAVMDNWQPERDREAVPHLLSPRQPLGSDRTVRIVDALQPPADNHYILSGLFRRTTPPRYDHETFIDLPVETLERFTWDHDFATSYKATLDSYWDKHFDTYRQCLMLNFIAACNKQAAEGSLKRKAVRLAWQAAGLQPAPAPIEVRVLNVYGYPATDILCFKGVGSPFLLYIPGNASPLHAFASQAAMQDWFAEQCRDPQRRDALKAHFNPADTPDGLSFSGLDTALQGLAAYPKPYHLDANRPGFTTEGIWAPRDYINYKIKTYSPALQGDLFDNLAKRYRKRSYQDGAYLIRSDGEVTQAKWTAYLDAAMNYLAPVALVVPELWPLFVAGGIAQFGLGLDQAINGKTQEEQAEGVEVSTFGLLNALPVVQDLTQEKPLLFRGWQDRFVMPKRVNGQFGYPLSPLDPPHLPPDLADTDIQALFTEPTTVPAQANANPDLARLVTRLANYHGGADELLVRLEDLEEAMVYDIARDAFILPEDLNSLEPTYYAAEPQAEHLTPILSERTVTNPMRMSTLRALGVDLPLPVAFPATDLAALQPIPRQVMSIWVGDRVIDGELLETLGKNAQALAPTDFSYRLYLSGATPAAFQENLRQLAEHAPTLEVLQLEEQPFFAAFRQSPYYAHYDAATSGLGSNYASAVDILRYRLLHHEGGLYLDVDDLLNIPAGLPRELQREVLALHAGADDLLLAPPMSHQSLQMDVLFNNSAIGSHPGNPTVQAISEEIHRRLLEAPDFFNQPRPLQTEDPVAFGDYAKTLRDLTGPGVLTDVVDKKLPMQATLRQVFKAMKLPIRHLDQVLDLEQFSRAIDLHQPLHRLVQIGGFKSWARE